MKAVASTYHQCLKFPIPDGIYTLKGYNNRPKHEVITQVCIDELRPKRQVGIGAELDPKIQKSLRICVDFTDLNKACPKDSFPLPHIDRLVEATAGNEVLSFMDAFSGYNQILMHLQDREKTSFITDRGIYCYKVMPYGLKNVGSTYQRLVNRMFASQLGRTMEVYIDDILVKSLVATDHVGHLRTCFDILDQYGMKLNPTKCIFRKYLSTPPVLSKPETGKTLYLYITISEYAVSSVLVWEDRSEHKPIFYISKSLDGSEYRYPTLEKFVFAVVISARKLCPYVQSHAIVVLTDHPLCIFLHSPSQSGRLAKWAIELSEYDIEYRSMTATKSQVLADFLIEVPPKLVDANPIVQPWILHADGSSSNKSSSQIPDGEILEQSFRLGFPVSNNEAKYKELIAGLRLAKGTGAEHVHVYYDSQLMAIQFHCKYEAKSDCMDAYLKDLASDFSTFELTKIPHDENATADALAALASNLDPNLR
ncbi:uncharacterized protein LOC112081486 [Eutrema salsugineum]|uniref:uncharacterized protein LOC112081486 n=1 Tax=Eutrema salsugineum TaxID=72664 RepID=UPI000CED7BD8|nr:uncharacterized protein LOC112081486 [Eutrema salsugineum]